MRKLRAQSILLTKDNVLGWGWLKTGPPPLQISFLLRRQPGQTHLFSLSPEH